MSFVTLVLCLVVLGVCLFHLCPKDLLRCVRNPLFPLIGGTNVPGPTEGIRLPLIGDALMFAGVKNAKGLWEIIQKLCSMREKIISLYLGPKLMIWILDAHILETLVKLNKCPDKDEGIYAIFQYVTEGVFSTSDRKTWVDLRRPLDRLMHQKNMNDFMVVFADKAKMACNKVQRICGHGVFNLKQITDYYSLDIALEIFFGLPGTEQVKDTIGLPDKFSRCVEGFFLRCFKPLYHVNWIYGLSSLGKETKKIKDELRPILERMFEDRLKKMVDKGFEPNDLNFEPQNFLEAAIQTGLREKKPREKMLFSVIDLMVAAYDTSSVALSSTILYLAMHSDYQEKAYQEQLSVMGDSLDEPTRAELSRMEFLEMLLNETIRKVSPPLIARRLDAEIKIDDYVLPEGAILAINYHMIHENPKFWERPGEFYPDHFLPENVAKRPKSAYLPFSFGSRSCPGKLFSFTSGKLILSMLLRRFKFTTSLQYSELSYKYYLMVECEQGYPVKATPRVISASS